MTVDINELFKGVAVVIDDEVNDTTANIQKVLNQISSLHIPVLKYTDIPHEDDISHFQSLSFVLLDWRLIKPDISTSDITAGVTIPLGLQEENITRNIAFIKRLHKICYCPVFIFTNEVESTITDKLVSENVCIPDRPSNILIKSKSSLRRKGSLQRAVQKWLQTNPSIYVLKEWEREYQKCKNHLFFDFQQMSPVWPQVMWKCFDNDGGNKSLELGELISRNLYTRMKPFEFKEELLTCASTAEDLREELRKVLEGARFIKDLHADDISTGDLFLDETTEAGQSKQRYWLNIRAQCDTIRSEKIDKTKIYCLRGRIIDDDSIYQEKDTVPPNKKGYRIIEGQFSEQINNAIVPFIDDGKVIEFLFRDLHIKEWKDVKTKRIGRLLPPYITRIQQRFALYLHRQGLPRLPDEAIFPQA